MEKNNVYETKSLNKLIMYFAIPAIIALIMELLTSVVDTIFAAQIGIESADSLAAMGLISPILGLFIALQTLFAASTGIMIAKYLHNKRKLNINLMTGTIMSILLSTIVSLLFYIFIDQIITNLNASEAVFIQAKKFLTIQLISNIFSSIGYTLTSAIRAIGKPRQELIIITLAIVINIVLNAIFVFGFKFGIQGIATSTLISEIVAALISVIYISKTNYVELKTKYSLKTFIKTAYALFKIGFAQTVFQSLASATGFIINDSLITLGGAAYLAAFNVVQKIYMLLIMPIIGLSNANQTIIAYFNKDKAKQNKIIRKTVLYAITYGIVIVVANYFYNDILFALFKSTQDIYELTLSISTIIFFTLPLVGIIYPVITYLQVTNYEMTSVFLGLTRQIFAIVPLVILIPIINEKLMLIPDNTMSIFFAIPIADIISTIVALIIMMTIAKKHALRKD
ncbi:MAG: MATE family efflux transporter [Mycoplasmatales bacterium]